MPEHPTAAVPPSLARLTYTSAAWDDEAFSAFAEGREPQPCPACGRVGFFGPRVAGVAKHRACRFCGFYQEADGDAARAIPTVHGCAAWPTIARAPYIWWAAPGDDAYTCSFCHARVVVADHTVTPPSEDPEHPWWRVPQGRHRFYYARFWDNWPVTRGRVFL